jgi:hypothetical protein
MESVVICALFHDFEQKGLVSETWQLDGGDFWISFLGVKVSMSTSLNARR